MLPPDDELGSRVEGKDMARDRARPRSSLLILIVCSLLLPGCMSFQPVPTEQIRSEVAVGDTLRVTTQAGMVLEFEVTSLGEGLLGGLDTSISLQDIRTLEKRELSVLRTLGLVSVSVLLVFVIGTMTVF
jgi:hypothetical protein